MSYLKFDKSLMINLEQSLPKEMLRTNRSGAYYCTTIVDCNTRKHHGLLVVPIPELGNEPHVLLSSLDETVVQHGAPFNLALHRYQGGVYSPNGHKYIREFECESVPRTTYRVGGVILTKERIFISHENRILIRYTLVDAHSATTLRLRPMLAFRNANSLVVENNAINTSCGEAANGVKCCLYPGYPTLYMQTSRKSEFHSDGHWYNKFEYSKDKDRGEPYIEDLWTPGYIELPLKKGESVIFSAGVSEVASRSLSSMYEKEVASRTFRTSFYNCLKNAAKQFYVEDGSDMYITSSYPWGKIRARDTFLALPGITLYISHREDFEKIMSTATKALERYMNSGELDSRISGIDMPDVPLWAAWAIQQYAKMAGVDQTRERYMDLISRILDYILDGGHPNLQVASNGLVETMGVNDPVSWMSSTFNGHPVVPRTGFLLEFNALFYNALIFASELAEVGDIRAGRWRDAAERMRQPFIDTFLNGYGYLYDSVHDANADPSVRPNMAIAIGLEYSPLDRRQRKGVLDVVTRELLTPKGLRTLSPRSYGYRPNYVGSPEDRVLAMHNGTARPWLMGFYAEAYLRVFSASGVGYIDRMLIGFEDDMTNGCIGSLSQLYDGNPPYSCHGAISHAVNVGEVIRVIKSLKNFEA